MKITIFNGKINEVNDQSVNTIGLMGTMSTDDESAEERGDCRLGAAGWRLLWPSLSQ